VNPNSGYKQAYVGIKYRFTFPLVIKKTGKFIVVEFGQLWHSSLTVPTAGDNSIDIAISQCKSTKRRPSGHSEARRRT
jgi:hypothetical protein